MNIIMYKKKYLNFIMVLVLLLQGCSSGLTQNDTGNSNADTNTVKKTATLKYITPESYNWPILNDSPVLKEIEKITNVRIEYIPISNIGYAQKVDTIIASGELSDLINLPITTINEFGSSTFMDFDKYLDTKAPNIKKLITPDVKINIINSDNKIYGMPLINIAKAQCGWLIRQDWLDRLNIKLPETLDEWKNAMKAFKENDPDGNGRNDTIPWQPYNGVSWLTYNVSPSFGLNPSGWTIEGLDLIFNPVSDKYKHMLQWFYTMYREDLMDKEYTIISPVQWEDRMIKSLAGATTSHIVRTDYFSQQGKKYDPDFKLIATPPLKGPDGFRGAPSNTYAYPSYCVAMTKNCKDIDAAIRYIDYIFSDEGAQLATWGVENISYNVINGSRVYVNEIVNNIFNPIVHSKYGILQPTFPRLVDRSQDNVFFGPNSIESIKNIEKYFIEPFPVLQYDNNEQERLKFLKSDITDACYTWTEKFINGEMSISNDWPKYLQTLSKLGLDEYISIQENAYRNYIEKYSSLLK